MPRIDRIAEPSGPGVRTDRGDLAHAGRRAGPPHAVSSRVAAAGAVGQRPPRGGVATSHRQLMSWRQTRVIHQPVATPLPSGFLAPDPAIMVFAAVQLRWKPTTTGRIAGLTALVDMAAESGVRPQL